MPCALCPAEVQGLIAAMGLTGAVLITSTGADASILQKADSVGGRYFAIYTSDPRREQIEITRDTYEALRKEDQQVAFAAYALIAAVGAGLTLVFARLDSWAGRT